MKWLLGVDSDESSNLKVNPLNEAKNVRSESSKDEYTTRKFKMSRDSVQCFANAQITESFLVPTKSMLQIDVAKLTAENKK